MNQEEASESVLVKDFLTSVLSENLSIDSFQWTSDKMAEVKEISEDIFFYQLFGKVPSVVGRKELNLSKHYQKFPGIKDKWTPFKLSTDQAARILLLISIAESSEKDFERKLRLLFKSGDVGELITLYLAFSLFPNPKELIELASEGVRSNMKSVFEAIALNNSFPSEHFKIDSWNQMVLKTVFLGCSVQRIKELDKRSNSKLAHMLSHFVHERWLAGRKVNPDVWQIAGPFINDRIIEDIKKLMINGSELEKEAGALACDMSSYAPAKKILSDHPDLKVKIQMKEITWESIAKKIYSEKQIELI